MKQLSKKYIKTIFKPRDDESHKGSHGHSLVIAGNRGCMGAAVIAARACLRSGTGLLTVNVPQNERMILQTAIPEAMIMMRENIKADWTNFSAIGIGPGIGTGLQSKKILAGILESNKGSLLLDADAINILAQNKSLLNKIPKKTILSPHVKEFDRLFGFQNNGEDRIRVAIKMAKKYNLIIVLKGNKTIITTGGATVINTTGNSGLAKGGSGDALSGIITAFLAQGYIPFDAAKLGVYIHGLAADIALENQSKESLLITDVIECLGNAFIKIGK